MCLQARTSRALRFFFARSTKPNARHLISNTIFNARGVVTGIRVEGRARTAAVRTVPTQRVTNRWFTSPDNGNGSSNGSKTYDFEEIKEFISKPSKGRILVDTREASELSATGYIPTALNIPIASQPDAFFIAEDEFEDRFGFARPSKDAEVVFYCKAGVRSRAAAQLAREAGWAHTAEYPGSWVDWDGKGGERVGGRGS